MSFTKTPLRPTAPLKKTGISHHQKRSYTTIILSGISVISLTVFGSIIFAQSFFTNVSLASLIDGVMPSMSGSILTVDPPKPINFLLVGMWGAGHDAPELTDTMLIASLNPQTKTLAMLSVPRDLWIEYPTVGAGRINELYTRAKSTLGVDGALRALAAKMTEITGQPIDHYMAVDFRVFIDTVDLVGGLEIDVPEDLIDRTYPDNNWGYITFRINAGLQTLDGSTALKYARSRHSTSDFDRSRRQQLVINAFRNKLLSSETLFSTSRLSEIFEIVTSRVTTDLSIRQLLSLANTARDIPSESFVSFQLSDACVSGGLCRGGAYLYPPERSAFNGASVMLPIDASASRPSQYDSIRLFGYFLFEQTPLYRENYKISIVTNPKYITTARALLEKFQRLGFPLASKPLISNAKISSTGMTQVLHVWDEFNQFGIPVDSATLYALDDIAVGKLPMTTTTGALYTTTPEPLIEIVLGADASLVFPR